MAKVGALCSLLLVAALAAPASAGYAFFENFENGVAGWSAWQQAGTASLVAEAEDRAGRRVQARIRTPEAYTFTGTAAAGVARRVLAGDVEVGDEPRFAGQQRRRTRC